MYLQRLTPDHVYQSRSRVWLTPCMQDKKDLHSLFTSPVTTYCFRSASRAGSRAGITFNASRSTTPNIHKQWGWIILIFDISSPPPHRGFVLCYVHIMCVHSHNQVPKSGPHNIVPCARCCVCVLCVHEWDNYKL